MSKARLNNEAVARVVLVVLILPCEDVFAEGARDCGTSHDDARELMDTMKKFRYEIMFEMGNKQCRRKADMKARLESYAFAADREASRSRTCGMILGNADSARLEFMVVKMRRTWKHYLVKCGG
jgi:hypothetical protein